MQAPTQHPSVREQIAQTHPGALAEFDIIKQAIGTHENKLRTYAETLHRRHFRNGRYQGTRYPAKIVMLNRVADKLLENAQGGYNQPNCITELQTLAQQHTQLVGAHKPTQTGPIQLANESTLALSEEGRMMLYTTQCPQGEVVLAGWNKGQRSHAQRYVTEAVKLLQRYWRLLRQCGIEPPATPSATQVGCRLYAASRPAPSKVGSEPSMPHSIVPEFLGQQPLKPKLEALLSDVRDCASELRAMSKRYEEKADLSNVDDKHTQKYRVAFIVFQALIGLIKTHEGTAQGQQFWDAKESGGLPRLYATVQEMIDANPGYGDTRGKSQLVAKVQSAKGLYFATRAEMALDKPPASSEEAAETGRPSQSQGLSA